MSNNLSSPDESVIHRLLAVLVGARDNDDLDRLVSEFSGLDADAGYTVLGGGLSHGSFHKSKPVCPKATSKKSNEILGVPLQAFQVEADDGEGISLTDQYPVYEFLAGMDDFADTFNFDLLFDHMAIIPGNESQGESDLISIVVALKDRTSDISYGFTIWDHEGGEELYFNNITFFMTDSPIESVVRGVASEAYRNALDANDLKSKEKVFEILERAKLVDPVDILVNNITNLPSYERTLLYAGFRMMDRDLKFSDLILDVSPDIGNILVSTNILQDGPEGIHRHVISLTTPPNNDTETGERERHIGYFYTNTSGEYVDALNDANYGGTLMDRTPFFELTRIAKAASICAESQRLKSGGITFDFTARLEHASTPKPEPMSMSNV